jgi:hypothetical protein
MQIANMHVNRIGTTMSSHSIHFVIHLLSSSKTDDIHQHVQMYYKGMKVVICNGTVSDFSPNTSIIQMSNVPIETRMRSTNRRQLLPSLGFRMH